MKIFNNIVQSFKNIFHSYSESCAVNMPKSQSEEVKCLIEKTITEKDRHLFRHFCHEDLRKFLDLLKGHELRDQSVEDILDHMDRELTKGPVSREEQEFCAGVILKMFKATDDRNRFFERIESHIGSEHFIRDLVENNAELRRVVEDLK